MADDRPLAERPIALTNGLTRGSSPSVRDACPGAELGHPRGCSRRVGSLRRRRSHVPSRRSEPPPSEVRSRPGFRAPGQGQRTIQQHHACVRPRREVTVIADREPVCCELCVDVDERAGDRSTRSRGEGESDCVLDIGVRVVADDEYTNVGQWYLERPPDSVAGRQGRTCIRYLRQAGVDLVVDLGIDRAPRISSRRRSDCPGRAGPAASPDQAMAAPESRSRTTA